MKHLWLAVLALAACVEEDAMAGTDWVLSSVDGQAVAYTATLNLGRTGPGDGASAMQSLFRRCGAEGAQL